MDSEAAAMFWDGTGLTDEISTEYKVGKRNARDRDGRKAMRANAAAAAAVGDKRRTWAGLREQGKGDGKRRKQRRGSGSANRRKGRRAREGQSSDSGGDVSASADDGASMGSEQGGWEGARLDGAIGESQRVSQRVEVFQRWAARWMLGVMMREKEGMRGLIGRWKAGVCRLGMRVVRLAGREVASFMCSAMRRADGVSGFNWMEAIELTESEHGGFHRWGQNAGRMARSKGKPWGWTDPAEEEEREIEIAKQLAVREQMQRRQVEEQEDAWKMQEEQSRREPVRDWREVEEAREESVLTRAERKGKTFAGRNWVVIASELRLGLAQQEVLAGLSAEDEEMRVWNEGRGAVLFNYKSGEELQRVAERHSINDQEKKELFQLLAECRGLVMQAGQVVARPVQRFHRVWEMGGFAKELRAEIVTEKLDGVTVCGVVVEGEVELWTRGGRTAQAQAAMRVAREQ